MNDKVIIFLPSRTGSCSRAREFLISMLNNQNFNTAIITDEENRARLNKSMSEIITAFQQVFGNSHEKLEKISMDLSAIIKQAELSPLSPKTKKPYYRKGHW